MALTENIDSLLASSDYASLMTVHSAKGLEFTNVFLCGIEEDLFPINASIYSKNDLDTEEERRLAYP